MEFHIKHTQAARESSAALNRSRMLLHRSFDSEDQESGFEFGGVSISRELSSGVCLTLQDSTAGELGVVGGRISSSHRRRSSSDSPQHPII